MKNVLLATTLVILASPALAFGSDREATIASLLATAEQYAPDVGVTSEMLEKLSAMQLRMFAMADCQGANKTASFVVSDGRIVGFSTNCSN